MIEARCNFGFDLESHTYFMEGRPIPSLTEILLSGRDQTLDLDDLELRNLESRRNYKILSDITKGVMPECRTEDALEVAEAFRLFFNREKPGLLLAAEIPLFSSQYNFAGTIDVLCQEGLLDLSGFDGDGRFQRLRMAGFHLLARENGLIDSRRGWWILTTDSGKRVVKNVYDPEAEEAFLGLLQIWHGKRVFANYMKRAV